MPVCVSQASKRVALKVLPVKYTNKGGITIRSVTFQEPEGLRDERQTAVEIVVEDTGCGIASSKLESIFREFEQVESAEPKTSTEPGVGTCSLV